MSSLYFNRALLLEDRKYFLREQKAEHHRAAILEQTKAYRQLHCAADDSQFYTFDRRNPPSSEKSLRFGPTIVRHNDLENRLIDRHEHKIRHLLHVLQDEISAETRREVRALNFWNPQKTLSRQSKRSLAKIIKERYEAADRIMRILEEYGIVIGVDAAKYLEDTIVVGKRVAGS